MIRILALVEGQTEATFVRELLAPELVASGIDLRAVLVGKPGHKGGIRPYPAVQRDLLRLLRGDPTAYITTMFDYYALPTTFPGRDTSAQQPTPHARANAVESAMLADISTQMGDGWNQARLMPYIQMHEFEAVLFSDPRGLAVGCAQPELAPRLANIRDAFTDPEHIDDGPETAPSKRIQSLFKGYEKPLYGTLAALQIGLPTMLAECPHFASWVARLKGLA